MVGGNVGNGPVMQDGKASATGASVGLSFGFGLQNLDSHTKDVTTNEAYHEINHNTLNRENIKDVKTDIYNTQRGNRIQGRSYNMNNHYNGGHESFGLQNLGMFKDLTGAISGAADLGGAIW